MKITIEIDESVTITFADETNAVAQAMLLLDVAERVREECVRLGLEVLSTALDKGLKQTSTTRCAAG